MFRNRRRRPAGDPRVPWLAIGQRVTRRQAKKREAEECDRPAQPAEQERQTQSDSPGALSVELLPDSSPLRPLADTEGRAQLGGPVGQPGAPQTPPLPEDEDADGGGPGALGDVRGAAVARMRFFEKPDPAASAVRGRLVVELQIASVPADERGSVDAVLRRSRETLPADDLSERLADATAEYVADTADNQARILFETPGSLGPEEVSAVLDRCQQKLVDMVKAPVEQLATGRGAPPLAAELAEGIGADFVLAREIRGEEGISAIIDICVIGIGYATGRPHLVAVAVKHLARTAFHEAVQRGASKILEDDPRKPGLAPHVTLPVVIKLDSSQSAKRRGPDDKRNPSPGGF